MEENYANHVEKLESNLAPYAKKSFDTESFVDGKEYFKFYQERWEQNDLKLKNRTPHQIERDRILYSNGIRKQTEKFHVLFKGRRRIVRNYITHTMRMMQITRAICRGLKLNEDFAEGIVLGSKLGAAPFIHSSKHTISNWMTKKITAYDQLESKENPTLFNKELNSLFPIWYNSIKSEKIKTSVIRNIPIATGKNVEDAYSTGKQSYWFLNTNPFTLELSENCYSPEIMFGIWRHSLNSPIGKETFMHQMKLGDFFVNMTWKDITYEALVVKYADDITWVIENINDANHTQLDNESFSGMSVYQELFNYLKDAPIFLKEAFSESDPGKIYTYFINDFIDFSNTKLKKLNEGAIMRIALKEGVEDAAIGLSQEATLQLENLKSFLNKIIFEEIRVKNRNKMLQTISEGCLDLLFDRNNEFVTNHIRQKGKIESWGEERIKTALSLISDDVHRIQIAVDVFSELGDQEILDFVGIESLT
jgi:dGTP triphosphohydrolase